VCVAKLLMGQVLRTGASEEIQEFMKALMSQDVDRIFGLTMIGSDAGDVMAAMQTAILAGAPYQTLSGVVLAHMTVAEAIGALLSRVLPRM
jgi:pyruvate/2-oxoglutarate dehydrogenase complex dihydrolipoamide dehydrogenase (E3) component